MMLFEISTSTTRQVPQQALVHACHSSPELDELRYAPIQLAYKYVQPPLLETLRDRLTYIQRLQPCVMTHKHLVSHSHTESTQLLCRTGDTGHTG